MRTREEIWQVILDAVGKKNADLANKSKLSLLNKLKRINKISLAKAHLNLLLLNQTVTSKLSRSGTVFITTRQLVEWSREFALMLPWNIDAVCAVPRSGFLPASIIALKMAKPLSTPDLLLEGLVWNPASGDRDETLKPELIRRVLLVDDSVSTGITMDKATRLLVEFQVLRCAVIVSPVGKAHVDYAYRIVKPERIFEWGLPIANYGRVACDMDGVLCSSEEQPLFVPTYILEAVVSCRPERERTRTIRWLTQQKVKYKKLILVESSDEKIRAIQSLRLNLFIESSVETAIEIWKNTHTPTLCFDRMTLYS